MFKSQFLVESVISHLLTLPPTEANFTFAKFAVSLKLSKLY